MDLKEKLRKALLDARAIADLAAKEKRDFTADERGQVKGFMDEAATIKAQIKTQEDDKALTAALAGFEAEMGGLDDRQRAGVAAAALKGTIGQRFVEAPEFKEWLKAIAPSGTVPQHAKGLISPPVEFKSLLAGGRKDLITGASDTSAGAFVQTDYTGIYEPLGRYPLNILGLIARRATGSDLVEFVRQTTAVAEAATVAEERARSRARSRKARWRSSRRPPR